VDALGAHRGDHLRLRVSCSRSHHVASIYETASGLVYTAPCTAHAHGSRDYVDAPHGVEPCGHEWADVLAVANDLMADDELPAGCECGPRTLSRTELLRAVAAHRRHLRVS